MNGRITSKTRIAISSDAAVMIVTSTVTNAQGQRVVNAAVYKKR